MWISVNHYQQQVNSHIQCSFIFSAISFKYLDFIFIAVKMNRNIFAMFKKQKKLKTSRSCSVTSEKYFQYIFSWSIFSLETSERKKINCFYRNAVFWPVCNNYTSRYNKKSENKAWNRQRNETTMVISSLSVRRLVLRELFLLCKRYVDD